MPFSRDIEPFQEEYRTQWNIDRNLSTAENLGTSNCIKMVEEVLIGEEEKK